MTVSVVEVGTADYANSASGSLTISTTLVSSDLIMVFLSRGASSTTTITINGSTPAVELNLQLAGNGRLFAYSKTGITGSHAVTYTSGAGTLVNRLTVLVIRGLTNSAVTASAQSDWSTTSTAAGVDEGPSGLSVGNGQVAIFAAMKNIASGTVTFPSNPTPSTGWVVDRNDPSTNSNHSWVAHQVFTSSATAQANFQSSNSSALGTVMLVVGDVVTSSPLTSTFVGWGNPIF